MKIKSTNVSSTLKMLGVSLAATLCVFTSSAASAAVMTFSGISGSQTLPSYTENGITAVSTAGGTFWGYPSEGQLHLDPSGFGNSAFDFTFGGAAFSVTSVDVSDAQAGAIGTWTAYDASNVLIATYVMSGATLHTDTGFSGFENVYRLHLVNSVNHFSIDNLVLAADDGTAVPEPISAALLSIGIAGIATSRRRNKKH